MKFVSDNATITEKKVSSDELLRKISELDNQNKEKKVKKSTKKKGQDGK